MQTEVRVERPAAAPPPAAAAGIRTAPAARQRRRRFWVDWRAQGQITGLGLLATLFFLVMFNITLHDLSAARREQIAGAVPEMTEKLRAEDRAFHRSTALLSGVFFFCVAVGMVVLTQRSAGPVDRIGAHLQRAARGDLQHRVELRRRDHFQSLAASCNQLLETLQRERQEDAARFERLAVVAERTTSKAAALALAAELREAAHAKR